MTIIERVQAQPRDKLITQNQYLKWAITKKLLKGMKVPDAARTYGLTRYTLWKWLDQSKAKAEMAEAARKEHQN